MKLACGRVFLGLVLVACGGSPAAQPEAPLANKAAPALPPAPPRPPPPVLDSATHSVAEALERMGLFRDAMCACTDHTCVDQLTDQMTRWGAASASQEPTEPISDAGAKQMADTIEELSRCMTKIMTATAQQRLDNAAPATAPADPP